MGDRRNLSNVSVAKANTAKAKTKKLKERLVGDSRKFSNVFSVAKYGNTRREKAKN